MGMDVFGKKPTDPVGNYFRANVWYWHPLWDYVETVNPEICSKVEYPHSNDGSGLNAKDSRILSSSLLKKINSGNTQTYIDSYYEYINSLPFDDCTYCNMTGFRTWNHDGLQVEKVCNACNGTLKNEHFLANYHMQIEYVEEFQKFLHHCGGFQIW
jgi:hypothetical protein